MHRKEHRSAYQSLDQEMDQCKRDNDNIIVIGATNYAGDCAKEFRNRFLEIIIDIPQCACERDIALSWYLFNDGLMRKYELKDIESLHQKVKNELPSELHNPFDQLIESLEKLTLRIIGCENNWQPTKFDFYHLADCAVAEIRALLEELMKQSKNFDDLIAQYSSLDKIRDTMRKAIEIQHNATTRQLKLDEFFAKNINVLYTLTEETDGWNFRELEELAVKIRKYNGTLTKEIVLALREDIKKETPNKNDSSIMREIGSITLRLAWFATTSLIQGVAQGYGHKWADGNNDKK